MDKLRKVGLSALAGSMAMFSASADVSLTGSGEFTYTNSGGTTDNTGTVSYTHLTLPTTVIV